MMPDTPRPGNPISDARSKAKGPGPKAKAARTLTRVFVLLTAGSLGIVATLDAQTKPARKPTSSYWVYVGAESADTLHRIRFGPDGTVVEKTITIGDLPNEMEGPHGLAMSAAGQ